MSSILINNKKYEGSLLKYLNYWILFIFCSFVGTAYAAESNPPVLNAISVDKSVVDVSNGPQTVTFSFDAYDVTGIDYSIFYLETPSGNIINSPSRDDNPNQESFSFDSSSPSGNYEIRSIYLYDIFGNNIRYDGASLLDFGLPSYIEVVNGAESDPPVLNAISVDKTVVDVSNDPQTVTFSFDAYDVTGIDYSIFYLETPSGNIINSPSRDDNPNQESFSFDSSSPSGNYEIRSIYLYDIFGNNIRYDGASLLGFGLPSYIEVISENFNFDFDFDKDGTLDALTDGLLLLRYAFGLRGDSLTNAAISSESTLTPQGVEANIEQAESIADIDNNGSIDALTDGLLLLRYAFGLRGDNLVDGAIASDSTRTTAEDIEAYIESYMP
jgi:hypothetical protein